MEQNHPLVMRNEEFWYDDVKVTHETTVTALLLLSSQNYTEIFLSKFF